MKNSLLRFAAIYALFVIIFVIQKPLFLLFYPGNAGVADAFAIIAHGFSMDLCMAAYLTVIPALLIIVGQWCAGQRWLSVTWRVYGVAVSGIIALTMVVDLVLYGYWGFRLDMTPVFYFTTSPSAAFASSTWWELLLGTMAVASIWVMIYIIFSGLCRRIPLRRGGGVMRAAVMIVVTALLFIPVRGGFTVSTMNPSRVYFSQDQHFNHAAMNPLFSLIYSASHQGRWDEQYRFMTAAEATEAISALDRVTVSAADSADLKLLTVERPDVVLVILESFSSHLMPSLGGEPVAMRLDSIASQGWLFDRFYACSFRTDRALPSIMSGFPGLPSTSLMKNVDKIEKAPSWPREMKNAGWNLSYFYGGDANFTNMMAYLVSQGFENVVSDKDFTSSQRSGKWGAHDHDVMAKALAEIRGDSGRTPRLDVIQTSSSHEPFEVPFRSLRFGDNPRLNAFVYTDSCLGAFVDSLRAMPRWDRTLVVIVPDHYGVYPQDIDDALQRHAIPLVLTGGALADAPKRISRTGSQNDIAATILGALGIGSGKFPFSKDLLAGSSPRYAFFTEPQIAGMVTDGGHAVFNCDADADVSLQGADSLLIDHAAHAYLQLLYDELSKL